MKISKSYLNPNLIPGIVVLLLSLYFIIENRRFYAMTPEVLGKYFEIKWVLIAHIFCGALALVSGPFLLWESFRNRFLKIHRLIGKIYIISILVSAVSALYLTFTTALEINLPYAFALQMLVFVWLTSTGFAYWAVRNKKLMLHKEWMLRSYLSTVAFVGQALVIKIPSIMVLGSFAEISPSIFWFSWAIPMFLYQFYLGTKQKR